MTKGRHRPASEAVSKKTTFLRSVVLTTATLAIYPTIGVSTPVPAKPTVAVAAVAAQVKLPDLYSTANPKPYGTQLGLSTGAPQAMVVASRHSATTVLTNHRHHLSVVAHRKAIAQAKAVAALKAKFIKIQKKLTQLDYYSGKYTGKYDELTKQAVTDFQLTNSLVANGKLTSDTYARLFSSDAKAKITSNSQLPISIPANIVVNPGSAQAFAQTYMKSTYGWGQSEFVCLVTMWNHESGWRANAENGSGAYGIPQALPGNKMASAGGDWKTNAQTQVKWGLSYIQDRYHTPCQAWTFWQAHTYY